MFHVVKLLYNSKLKSKLVFFITTIFLTNKLGNRGSRPILTVVSFVAHIGFLVVHSYI